MTNKINGIDVSEYFINHYDSSGKLYAVEYKGNPLELQNAIKRLQKENEKLKNKNNDLIEEIASGNVDIAILQKENEGLKKEVKILREQIFKDNEQYIDLYDDYVSDLKLTRKYKQAFEEIREIVKEERADIKTVYTRKTYERLNKIQKKINEVLNDRD